MKKEKIIEKMAEFIVSYVDEKRKIWTCCDDKEEVRAKFEECGNILEVIKEENLDFDELYRDAFLIAADYNMKKSKYIRIFRTEVDMITRMAQYMISYAQEKGAWASLDDKEEVRAEFSECDDILDVIEEQNLGFEGLYEGALDMAYNKFKYKIALSYYEENMHLHRSTWYSKDKDRLVEKFYEDDNHSEYYTKDEIYGMIERI